jgi:hybrid cluster-associated redox disulfide protein
MEEDVITIEMVVANVLRDWPQTIPVFIEHRLGCLGCAMSDFDTLADVVEIYDLQADRFLNELRDAIES